MPKQDLNKNLIDQMREKIADGQNLANFLIDTLYLSKEAVYRRLRGDVSFTLSEASVISKKLSISLDALNGNSFNGNAMFDLNTFEGENPIKSYEEKLDVHLEIMQDLDHYPGSSLNTAYNMIPQSMYLKFPNLAKFRFFKWQYRHFNNNVLDKFDSLEMPKHIREKQLEFINYQQNIDDTTKVIDHDIFRSFIDDVNYFTSLGAFSQANIDTIQEELLLLINDMETFAINGRFPNGKSIDMYISPINFEASYSYFESSKMSYSLIRVFYINSITTIDPRILNTLKSWFKSLKNSSTHISQSGEVERRKFFSEQRELVNHTLIK